MADGPWGPVTVVVHGREHDGRYRLSGDTLVVETPYGLMRTPIGAMRAGVVAQSLLLTAVMRTLGGAMGQARPAGEVAP